MSGQAKGIDSAWVDMRDTLERLYRAVLEGRIDGVEMENAAGVLVDTAMLSEGWLSPEAAQALEAQLAEARATSKLHAEAAARALARESVLREALGEAHERLEDSSQCCDGDTDPNGADVHEQKCTVGQAMAIMSAALASPDTAAKERDERLRAEARIEALANARDLMDYFGTEELDEHDAEVRAEAVVAYLKDLDRTAFVEAVRAEALRDAAKHFRAVPHHVSAEWGHQVSFGHVAANVLDALAATRHEAKCEKCGGVGHVQEGIAADFTCTWAPCPSCTGRAVKP